MTTKIRHFSTFFRLFRGMPGDPLKTPFLGVFEGVGGKTPKTGQKPVFGVFSGVFWAPGI